MNALTFTRLLATGVVWMAIVSVQAQTIKVVDKEGRGIPYAMVLNTKGNLIGTTNLLGILADVRGANEVLVTHVAYKPQQVFVDSLKIGNVIMENMMYLYSDIIEKDSYCNCYYTENYYRVYAFKNDSLNYYRAGIMPYARTRKKPKMGKYEECSRESDPDFGKRHGITDMITTHLYALSVFMPKFFRESGFRERFAVTIGEDDGNGWQRITNSDNEMVGKIMHSDNQTCLSFDMAQMAVNDDDKPPFENCFFTGISINDKKDHSKSPDLKMFSTQQVFKYNETYITYVTEIYIASRCFTNTEDFKFKEKLLKFLYKAPMSLEKLEGYASGCNIPTLAPTLRCVIDELFEK